MSATIVVVAGSVKLDDRVGHHDYRAGGALLATLLSQTPGVTVVPVDDGWPSDEQTFETARAIVFYAGPLEKHAFRGSPRRIECLQRAIDRGVGVVMIHQAVRCSREVAPQATTWTGGVHLAGVSSRGHWPTDHARFPAHPVTRGVRPWAITDGWLTGVQFVDEMRGITPLVWSSRERGGSSAGGAPDVVAWTYDRPDGGRSFCFTGLDAHSAWSIPGVRQLVVNGILWTAGYDVPAGGAPCDADESIVQSYLTPRRPASRMRRFWRGLRRLSARLMASVGDGTPAADRDGPRRAARDGSAE